MAAAPTPRTVAPARQVGIAPLLGFGMMLARRGPMAVTAMTISVLTAVVICLFSFSFVFRDGERPTHDLPLLASSALVWGGGFLHAFAASAGALRRDRVQGIHHLVVTRTTSLRGYLLARVGGLALLLAIVTAGGTLLVGLGAVLAATRSAAVSRTIQATFASMAFAVAFAIAMAPIALAALGARSRATGYFFLLALLVVPEIASRSLAGVLPTEVTELCALPSALAALRASLMPGAVDPLQTLRAVLAIAIFAGVGVVFVRRDVLLLERESP